MSGKLLDTYPAGATIYALFDSFDANGASVTLTGLAVTDIEIYKNGSVTQRASDAGYALLDTDGIDFDGITGIHGISIDLSDNTDAGFYAAGSQYTVVVSAVTIASQTVSFILGAFRIVAAESTAGTPSVNAKEWAGAATATDDLALKATLAKGTDLTGFNDLDAAGVRSAVGLAAANLDTQLTAIDDYIDTEVAAIKSDTAAILLDTGTNGVVVAAASKTGYSLSAAGIQAIWDALTSALTTAGSIGKLLVDNINATISSRLASASYTAPLDAAGTRSALGMASADLDTQLSAIQSDTNDIQARLPAALTAGGNMKSDALALNGDTTSAASIAKTTRAIGRGTVATGGTTTSIPTSAFTPNGAVADQFKGRIITFDADTTTAALRGQSTDITASTGVAAPTFTVTALTTAPASGDTFSVT